MSIIGDISTIVRQAPVVHPHRRDDRDRCTPERCPVQLQAELLRLIGAYAAGHAEKAQERIP